MKNPVLLMKKVNSNAPPNVSLQNFYFAINSIIKPKSADNVQCFKCLFHGNTVVDERMNGDTDVKNV